MLTYTIEDFINTLRADNRSKSSIKNTRYALEQLNRFKPLEEVTANDISEFIIYIREEHGYTEGTINNRKNYIKRFYKMNDLDAVVKNVKIPKATSNLNPKDILIATDIDLIIENLPHPKYKALVAVLWESGGRIEEVLSIEKEADLIETDLGYKVTLFGDKTRQHNYAYREMLLSQSAPFVRDWLLNNNSDSKYLFPIGGSVVRTTFNKLYDKLNKEFGFKKPLNPHMFKHACATRLVREEVQESVIRKQLGWTPDSNMLAIYIHLASSDVYDYHARKIAGKDKDSINTKIKQPATTAFDRIGALEAVVKSLINERFEREALLDFHTQHHPEEFEPEPLPTPILNESLSDIQRAVTDFDVEKGIEEAEKRKALEAL